MTDFDPSRITAMLEGVDAKLLEPIVKKAADEFYCTMMETTQDYLLENLDWNLKQHVSTLESSNRLLSADNYDLRMEIRRREGQIYEARWLVAQIAQMHSTDNGDWAERCMELGRQAYAILCDSGSGPKGEAGTAECEASQSGDIEDGASPNPSPNPGDSHGG